MHSRDTQYLKFLNEILKNIYNCAYKALLANPVTYAAKQETIMLLSYVRGYMYIRTSQTWMAIPPYVAPYTFRQLVELHMFEILLHLFTK